MTKETPREIALKCLLEIEKKNEFSSIVLNRIFKRYPHLDLRDRAFISNIVQGVIRWKLRLDWIIENTSSVPLKKINRVVLSLLRMGTYQIMFLDRVPDSAAVNETVNLAKKTQPLHISSFVNGILRSICREKDTIKYPDAEREPERFLSIYYSYPGWLVKKWIKELGFNNTESLLKAGNRTPSLYLRTNLLKTDRETLISQLIQQKIPAKSTEFPPECVMVDKFRGRMECTRLFREGIFQIQERASQIISHLLAPTPGDMILDLCSGAGIKSTHLAQLMKNKGKIIALDITAARLKALHKNSKRLGLDIINTVCADASTNLLKLIKIKFEKIILDVPCSGLGTISRHPDSKWRKQPSEIETLSRIQRRLLKEAGSILKKGGIILYATCTISKDENEGIIYDFLGNNPEFSLVDISQVSPPWCHQFIDQEGFFRTMPHIHDMDGFFCALIMKHN